MKPKVAGLTGGGGRGRWKQEQWAEQWALGWVPSGQTLVAMPSISWYLGTKYNSVLTSGPEQVIFRNTCPECEQENFN